MKKSIFVLLFLTFFAGSAMALTNGEIKKCTGKLHACFQSNYSLLVDLNPFEYGQCIQACGGELATGVGNGGCADLAACESRCVVAFDIDTSIMCD